MGRSKDKASWQEQVEAQTRDGRELLKERTNDVPARLIEVLEGDDILMAMFAAQRLQELGVPEAVEPLIHILRTSNEAWFVAFCSIVLSKMDDERAVVPLIEVLEQAEARADADMALHQSLPAPTGLWGWLYRLRGDDRYWRELAETTRENVRLLYIRHSMNALAALQATQAVEPIRKRLADPDARIQADAQKAFAALSAA